jgi:hypothetical protein
MALYSYIVKDDTGFAPNPFFGYCTLACCKPGIRKHAERGDWIVGLTPRAKGNGNKIVFCMKVDECLPFSVYWSRFKQKRPDPKGGLRAKNGDNIYEPKPGGYLGFRQLPSAHSTPKFENGENRDNMKRDLNGNHVLVSRKFAYFGSLPMNLPEGLEDLIVGRSYRRNFADGVKDRFLAFTRTLKFRRKPIAPPRQWRTSDKSWKGSGCSGA